MGIHIHLARLCYFLFTPPSLLSPLIRTPPPHSRCLHRTALRYARGVCMWQNGLNGLKLGTKWAQLTGFSTP